MADYLGTTPRLRSFFQKDWTRPNLTPAECAGIWLKVLSTIFCNPNDHPFQIKPQYLHRYQYILSPAASQINPNPVWVLFDDETTIAVVEVRSSKQPSNWSSVKGQAYSYISDLPSKLPSTPTIGIIAQGDKFICWEQTAEQCTVPRRLFTVRGEPVSVVDDSELVQSWFEEVRERAIEGDFAD